MQCWSAAGRALVAPPLRFPSVESQLVELLAKCRRLHYPFDHAWWLTVEGGGRKILTNDPQPPALAVRWPSDRDQRADAERAILGCRDAFARAYPREPATPGDRAVLVLHDLLAASERDPVPRQPPWSGERGRRLRGASRARATGRLSR